MLNHKFSPDAIVGQASKERLKLFPKDEMVCTRTLYKYITLRLLKTKDVAILQKVSWKSKSKHSRTN